jgi:hypothetical protein
MSVLANIASSVAVYLSAVPELDGAVVNYRHLEEIANEELASLKVAVIPRGVEVTNTARGAGMYEYRVGIYVAKHVVDDADADAMMTLTEELVDKLRADTWGSAVDGISCTGVSVQLATEDSINERNAFRATMEVTYKVLK